MQVFKHMKLFRVSLVGINTIHTIPTNTTLKDNSDIDNYYLEVNRSALDP